MKLPCALILASVMAAAAAPKPNLVMILADDLGFSDIGCYGGEIDTPNLDALAAKGLRFTQFYNTGRCWPTRASLLTGYYAQQIHRDSLPDVRGGIRGARQGWARLLPDLLKPAGYRSYHSGKWHIDGKVLAGGFDRSLNVVNPGNFFTARGSLLDDVPVKPPADESGHYATVATADHAIECLREHAANHADRPFFQYIGFHAPHFPLHALPEDIAKYRDRYLDGWEAMRAARFAKQREAGIVNTALSALEPDVGPPYAFPDDLRKLGPGEVDRPLPWSGLTPEQRGFQAVKMAIHAAMVDRMDREIGRVIAQLKAMGAYENTLILFASDNGASSEIMVRDGGHDPLAEPGSAASYLCLGPGFSSACNTPFRRHKVWLHEGGIATPLIAHWPAGIRSGNLLRHSPSHVIDFVPTALELAGVAAPTEWNGEPIPGSPGKSLVPAFSKDVTIARDCLWWMHDNHRAVRVGDWKLVADAGEPWELYDLKTDRAEQKNLATEMPEKVRELESVWQGKADAFTELVRKTPANHPGGGVARAEVSPPFTPKADVRGDWAMTPDPALPNVLILGDSISIGYTRDVRRLLDGHANVFRPMAPGGRQPANCGDTTIGLANLDAWLGGRKWDVIHFNWGLWDLCYRNPEARSQGNRDKVKGKISTPPDDYRRNLDALVTRLKATGAKLVWASTTLVPEGETGRFTGDDIKYNEIAAGVMKTHGVAINDLHAVTRAFPPSLFVRPGDVHFTPQGSAKLASTVAATIQKLLEPAESR
jgi:arylsulfatase A-like enzyme